MENYPKRIQGDIVIQITVERLPLRNTQVFSKKPWVKRCFEASPSNTFSRPSQAAWSHPCVLVSISIIRKKLWMHIHITSIVRQSVHSSKKRASQFLNLSKTHSWIGYSQRHLISWHPKGSLVNRVNSRLENQGPSIHKWGNRWSVTR